jgi:hypothetical protein
MSWDLAVLSGAEPLDADQAAGIYVQLCEGVEWAQILSADPRITRYVTALTDRWPSIDDVAEDDDRSPWSVAHEVSPAHVLISMGLQEADDVAPVCIKLAMEHGLNVYDPQEECLHSPGLGATAVSVKDTEELVCSKCCQSLACSEMYVEEPDGRLLHFDCAEEELFAED